MLPISDGVVAVVLGTRGSVGPHQLDPVSDREPQPTQVAVPPLSITPGTSEAICPCARALFLLWAIRSLSEVMPKENTVSFKSASGMQG